MNASSDTLGITMLDSMKVYVKTKDAFGWPEDSAEPLEPCVAGKPTPVTSRSAIMKSGVPCERTPLTSANK